MTNIKVTVEYEVPKTSKFDALIAEYTAAKQIADETESYYKPLADMAEEAKLDAILKQIEPIKYYAQKISQLKGGEYLVIIEATHYGQYANRKFVVAYDPCCAQHFSVRWGYNAFTKEQMVSNRFAFCSNDDNILGNWDAWGMYKKLEESAIRQMQDQISKQKERSQKQIDRLKNIQGGI